MTDRAALRLSAEITAITAPADRPIEVEKEVEEEEVLKDLEQQRIREPSPPLSGKKKERCELGEGDEEEGRSGGDSATYRDIEVPVDAEQTGEKEGLQERDSLFDLLVACASKLESVSDQSKSSRLLLP